MQNVSLYFLIRFWTRFKSDDAGVNHHCAQWRDTDPKKMKCAIEPIGLLNDDAILSGCNWGDCTIAAWGNHGIYLDRGYDVMELLRKCAKPIFHLGISKVGQPKHPLYISYEILPKVWLGVEKFFGGWDH